MEGIEWAWFLTHNHFIKFIVDIGSFWDILGLKGTSSPSFWFLTTMFLPKTHFSRGAELGGQRYPTSSRISVDSVQNFSVYYISWKMISLPLVFSLYPSFPSISERLNCDICHFLLSVCLYLLIQLPHLFVNCIGNYEWLKIIFVRHILFEKAMV